MPNHVPPVPDFDEEAAKRLADRIVGTLIQTYLAPPVIEILRNSVMANHDPKMRIAFTPDTKQNIRCEVTLTQYDGAHDQAFPLKISIRIAYESHMLWRQLYAVINASPMLNMHYVVTDLNLDIDNGVVMFHI